MIRVLLLVIGLCSGISTAKAAPVSRQDPEASLKSARSVSTASGSAVVVTGHPQASAAALAALQAGGHAIDALVAAQTVLAVVEPQSSGLGGGGFLLHWNARLKELEVLDGRETAPERSRPDDFLDAQGRALPWTKATSSLQAIGIPGTVALLWEAHQQHGRRPWAELLDPAITLARDGFEPSPRLLRSIALAKRIGVSHSRAFQRLYQPDNATLKPGQRFRNPALARTLDRLARHGGLDFYRGALAHQVLRELTALKDENDRFRGWSASDLASYRVMRRQPLCSWWRSYRLCSVPAPSSGGLAVQQSLALWDALGGLESVAQPAGWQRLAQAQAWADADRLYWTRDPIDATPWFPALLDPTYIQSRALRMKGNLSLKAGPGLPPGQLNYPFARPDRGREDGTTQISIVDREGNLVSYTASVETVFGSRHLVAGMVMNNQLTDFSLHPSIGGEPVANQRRPGRRPMSSMAPTIVFLAGQPVLAAGSPGGRRIPHFVSRTLLAALAWQEPPHRAVALPHLSVSDGALVLEQDGPLPWPMPPEQLMIQGHAMRFQRFGSGTALLQRIEGRWHGAADPRREGKAMALP